MQRTGLKNVLVLMGIVIGAWGCSSTPQDAYNQLVKKELGKGIRQDSLFLGINFGMTSKEFFGYCWELNKKGILTDGSNNTMVLYKMDSALKYPASMNFYPDFHENKIFHMRVTFQYNAWAPWNKAQFSDSLLPDVLRLYKQWYPGGNPFIKMEDKDKRVIYVKVDGNRRILLGRQDDMIIRADYTDLLVEKKLQ
jgi:hypothetical protein